MQCNVICYVHGDPLHYVVRARVVVWPPGEISRLGTTRPVAAGAVTAACRASCSPASHSASDTAGVARSGNIANYITSKLILSIIFEHWIRSHDQVFDRSHFPTVLLLMCGPAGAGGGPGWVDGARLGPGSLAADCRLQQPPLQHCRRPPADLEPLQLHRPALQGSKGLHFPRMILGTLLGIHLSDV